MKTRSSISYFQGMTFGPGTALATLIWAAGTGFLLASPAVAADEPTRMVAESAALSESSAAVDGGSEAESRDGKFVDDTPRARGKGEVVSTSEEAADDEGSGIAGFNLDYFALLFGPSVGNPSGYQVRDDGTENFARPVQLQNFFTVSRRLGDTLTASGTANFAYEPTQGGQLYMKDPFARVACGSILGNEEFNWYGDFRTHFPVTNASRQRDLLTGLQTFHAVTYLPSSSRLGFATYFSARYNIYGTQGIGRDAEFYFAPNLSYRASPTFSFTLLYEFNGSHGLGEEVGTLSGDGMDIEPGFSWDITPRVNFNPYLTIQTSGSIGPKTTSLGMMLSWRMI